MQREPRERLQSFLSVERRTAEEGLKRPDTEERLVLATGRYFGDGFDDASLDTLVEAWASMKSFRAKDGSGEPPAPGRNGERDFHGEKRINSTHESTTDPEAKLFHKGKGQASKL